MITYIHINIIKKSTIKLIIFGLEMKKFKIKYQFFNLKLINMKMK